MIITIKSKMDTRDLMSVEKRLQNLKFKKELKKDYYKHFPSISVYREICELISLIKYLEYQIKN